MGQAIYTLAQSLLIERLHLPLETILLEIQLDRVGNVQMKIGHPALAALPVGVPRPRVVPVLVEQPPIAFRGWQEVPAPPTEQEILKDVAAQAEQARRDLREQAGPGYEEPEEPESPFRLDFDRATGQTGASGSVPAPLRMTREEFAARQVWIPPKGGSSTAPVRSDTPEASAWLCSACNVWTRGPVCGKCGQ